MVFRPEWCSIERRSAVMGSRVLVVDWVDAAILRRQPTGSSRSRRTETRRWGRTRTRGFRRPRWPRGPRRTGRSPTTPNPLLRRRSGRSWAATVDSGVTAKPMPRPQSRNPISKIGHRCCSQANPPRSPGHRRRSQGGTHCAPPYPEIRRRGPPANAETPPTVPTGRGRESVCQRRASISWTKCSASWTT
jgi:hypothetical protein